LLVKSLIGVMIRLYRKTPLYPGWGGRLAKLLGFFTRFVRGAAFVHDTGHFRMRIDLNQIIDSQIYYSGTFEPLTEATIERLLDSGGYAIDVGANVGYLTMVMANRVGKTGRVIAFEPTPWAYHRLEDNLSLNDMPQAHAVQMGLSDRSEQQQEMTIRSSYRLDGQSEGDRVLIDITTLDSYLESNRIDGLDFIKIDTDGMEYSILRGAKETLLQYKPAVLFEVGPDALSRAGTSVENLLAWLRDIGYLFYAEKTLSPYKDLEDVISHLPKQTSINVVAMANREGVVS